VSAVGLKEFADKVHHIVKGPEDGSTVHRVAAEMSALLANPNLLAGQHIAPTAERYRQEVLYVDPVGRFSILALVFGPKQSTPIHDHAAWCVVGVYRGEERETEYCPVPTPSGGVRTGLEPRAISTHVTSRGRGDITYSLPDQGVHRVENAALEPAVSIHVYGLDIRRAGTSIRMCYKATNEFAS
jgi:predicted metal-dependent enzyme (double-stranded beta helix superfamily)